jgi:hypothetical protein
MNVNQNSRLKRLSSCGMIDAGEEASMATQPYKTVPVVEQTQGSDFATYVKPSATIKLVSSVRD